MRAIQITQFGGPEVLKVVELPDPVAGDGLQVLEVTSAGVNYADTHQVEDSYLSRTELPLVPGTEVVGRLPDGTRVAAFAMGGGYAEKALVHPAVSFPLPDGVSDGQALSLMVQGLTAWHLLRVIGFWLAHCFTRPEMLGPPMAELLSMVEAGTLRPIVGGTYPLSEAYKAHEALLDRSSHGKLILDCTA